MKRISAQARVNTRLVATKIRCGLFSDGNGMTPKLLLKSATAGACLLLAAGGLSASPAQAADSTTNLDSTVTGESVLTNTAPITLAAGVTKAVIKLQPNTVDLFSFGTTGVGYYFDGAGVIPGLSGYADINQEDMTVTVPIPANFTGYTPAAKSYCANSFLNTCASPQQYTGFSLRLINYGAGASGYVSLWNEIGLIQGSGSGPSTINIDLGNKKTYAETHYAHPEKVTVMGSVTDKVILRAPSGFFTKGPLGKWSGGSVSAGFYPQTGGFMADADVATSSDGRTLVASVATRHLVYACYQQDTPMQLNVIVKGSFLGEGLDQSTVKVGPMSCPVKFSDVAVQNQFYKEINWLASQGISTGYGDGSFLPVNTVNRDAMAAFLYRMAGKPAFTPPTVSPFADVAPSSQFYKEITWLASTGITSGWNEGNGVLTFRPVTPVNRDAMAAFLYRFAGKPVFSPPPASPFSDVATSGQFYKEISWLASTGISTGWDEGNGIKSFRASAPVNRDSMAAFLYRFDTWKLTR
ncbi:S-layer homology domain-containing protein [Paenarthrobacter sp. NPDC056912]|uniref:S-layer homology domain-containing protein n=1 Tax=Paenarthrobacter sp. NPDC056912 TaxID=3345965 RepID=UPI003671231A